MKRPAYATDLRDAEWAILEPLIPAPLPNGRPAKWARREIVNAILYVLKTGCAWHLLPHDFPAKGTVYHYYNTWRKDGTWQRIMGHVREQLRQALGREASPSAAIVDSQSVKTTENGAVEVTTPTRK